MSEQLTPYNTPTPTPSGDGIAQREPQQPQQFTTEEVETLRRTVCQGTTDEEMALFLQHCKRTGLDPFTGQIHAVMRWDSREKREVMSVQVGIDGFRLIADRTGKWRGRLGPYWCGPDGEWRDIWLPDTHPIAAKVGILRSDFDEPVWGIAKWGAYVATKRNGKPNYMWTKMPAHMLAKCAEALALRSAFPNDLSGLYTTDEMGQADNPSPPQPKRQTQHRAPSPSSNGHGISASDDMASLDHLLGERGDPGRDERFPRVSEKTAEALVRMDQALLDTDAGGLDNKLDEIRTYVTTKWSGEALVWASHLLDLHTQRKEAGTYPSDGQIKRMYAIAGDTWSPSGIDALVKRGWGYDSKSYIPSRAVYEEICWQLADADYASIYEEADTMDVFEEAEQETAQRQANQAPSEDASLDRDSVSSDAPDATESNDAEADNEVFPPAEDLFPDETPKHRDLG